MPTRLPDNCLSMYADLMDKVWGQGMALPPGGSFVAKKVDGKTYWYYQTRQVAGKRKQIAIGRETPELLARIDAFRAGKSASAALVAERRRLVGMLSIGGATVEVGRPAKLIDSVSRAGLFDAGGILVGSFAYACYGNMLGVSFDKALMRTSDMDFSLDRHIEIGVRRTLVDDLTAVEPSLSLPRQINPAINPFELVAADGFKVEFLTTRESPADKAPILIERFAVHALPLAFMDYLFENVQQAVILNGAAIPVKVPEPARFALHKLAVAQLRPIGMKAKADKDVHQAQSLLEVLLDDNPGLVLLAAEALTARDDMMASSVRQGAQRLDAEVRGALLEMLPGR